MLYKIMSNNADFIVYANFSMVARLPEGKATRNKETMCAKYIYSIYIYIIYYLYSFSIYTIYFIIFIDLKIKV